MERLTNSKIMCPDAEDGKCAYLEPCDNFKRYNLLVIEDILGSDCDLDRLREMVKADREGRCVMLHDSFSETTGDKALKQSMYICSITNNEVTRYTADAIAEKVVRESEAALEKMKERENNE